ncbi:hypothetical protein Tco_1447570 [Tanacetum coccineum]
MMLWMQTRMEGSALVPWIYIQQFWHTLKLNNSKTEFTFDLDTKELLFSVDDLKRIFQLPQATDNNNVGFVASPSFSQMLPFFQTDLGFSLLVRLPSHFVSKGLPQPWQKLVKIFARCLTTRVTGHDQSPFQIMHILYCFINNIHADYVELLWKRIHYSYLHPTSLIPYPRFTKIIVDHYMTENPDISRRLHEHYVHTTQSQPIESTQGTHRTFSALRTHNPETTKGELSAQRKPTMIRVQEHLVDEELEQLLEGNENMDTDAFMDEVLNSQEDLGTRIEPRSDKESPEVKKSADMLIIHDEEEEEGSARDKFELKRREKGKGIEESKDTPPPTPIKSPRTHTAPLSTNKETLQELTAIAQDAPSYSDKEKLHELTVTDPTPSSSSPKPKTGRFKRYKSFIKQMGRRYGYLFGHLKKTFVGRKKFHELAAAL